MLVFQEFDILLIEYLYDKTIVITMSIYFMQWG